MAKTTPEPTSETSGALEIGLFFMALIIVAFAVPAAWYAAYDTHLDGHYQRCVRAYEGDLLAHGETLTVSSSTEYDNLPYYRNDCYTDVYGSAESK